MKLVQTRWRAVFSTNDYPQETQDAEISDLTAALKKLKTPATEIERICEAHRAERDKLQKFKSEHETWKTSGGYEWTEKGERPLPPIGAEPKFPDVKFVPGLPEEFVDYFDGACAWHRDTDTQRAKARAAWERLLARPPAERKYKST